MDDLDDWIGYQLWIESEEQEEAQRNREEFLESLEIFCRSMEALSSGLDNI